MAKQSFVLREQKEFNDDDYADEADERLRDALERIQRDEELRKIVKQKNVRNPEYWTYLISKNLDYFAVTFMELTSLLVTYPLLTIKTRVQAKHLYEDVSFFTKNKVRDHTMLAGFSQGLLSVLVGNTISINTFRLWNDWLIKTRQPTSTLGLGLVNLESHLVADMLSLPFRHIFDMRRIYAQMNDKSKDISRFLKGYYRSLPACLLRDIIFRITFNITDNLATFGKFYYYYYTSDREMIDINEYQKRITFDQRSGALIVSTFLAAFLSNPFDVVATKLVTQQYEKYTGPINCFKTVLREEKWQKLWLSGFSARGGFFAANGYIVLMYYSKLRDSMQEAFSV